VAFQIVLGIHVLLCLLLIGLVLLQQGKGADAGAVLGGSSNTLFGAGGATSLMVKVTTAVAVCFMITSIFLVRGYGDLLENAPVGIQVQNPGLPEAPAPGAAPAAPGAADQAPAGAAVPAAPKAAEPVTSQDTSPAAKGPENAPASTNTETKP
jgi:preprotein translocase subunit SecG